MIKKEKWKIQIGRKGIEKKKLRTMNKIEEKKK